MLKVAPAGTTVLALIWGPNWKRVPLVQFYHQPPKVIREVRADAVTPLVGETKPEAIVMVPVL
jgi:hypothetical protein